MNGTTLSAAALTPPNLAFWLCPFSLAHPSRWPVAVAANRNALRSWQRQASRAWLRQHPELSTSPTQDSLAALAALPADSWNRLQQHASAHLISEPLRQRLIGRDIALLAQAFGETAWREAVIKPISKPINLFAGTRPKWLQDSSTHLAPEALVQLAFAAAASLTTAAFKTAPAAVRERVALRLPDDHALPDASDSQGVGFQPQAAREWLVTLATSIGAGKV